VLRRVYANWKPNYLKKPTWYLPVATAFMNLNAPSIRPYTLFRVALIKLILRRHVPALPNQKIRKIPHPRFGFYGVVDERFDIELLREIAALRPEWHWVIIGPVVKIDPATLPQAQNIHYLGGKDYKELPTYLSSWDVATMPFAINESTKYISPTKTPEYLAGGKPVVSTPIRDVIRPYGDQQLVHIASTAPEFVTALEKALQQREDQQWLAQTDAFLANISWDHTWQNMVSLIQIALTEKSK
jgi:glycosyltransferase involved in cell wall biosynthesis